MGRLDPVDVHLAVRQTGESRREVLPAGTVVLRHPDVAIVGAGVQQAWLQVRLCQGHDGAIGLRTRGVERHAAGPGGRRVNLGLQLLGQVGRDQVEVLAALDRLEHAVAGEVDHRRIVRRDQEGRIPIEAQGQVDRVLLAAGREAWRSLPSAPCSSEQRVALDGRDRILPPAVLLLPRRLAEALPLAGLQVDTRGAAAL